MKFNVYEKTHTSLVQLNEIPLTKEAATTWANYSQSRIISEDDDRVYIVRRASQGAVVHSMSVC